MLEKYKKMGLAAATCMLLGVNSSEAAVTLTFAQSGPNVTATWSGTYTGLPSGNIGLPQGSLSTIGGLTAFGREPGDSGLHYVAGMASATGLVSANGSYIGATFGFTDTSLIFPVGAVDSDFSPVGTMTFANTTLAALGADAFSNTLAFTGTGDVGGNKTISFNTIPEPSGIILTALGCLGLVFRRRRL